MKKILVIFGTRPEAIKMCPLVLEIKRRKTMKPLVVTTGQHGSLVDEVLHVFGVEPDLRFPSLPSGGTLTSRASELMIRAERAMRVLKPDLVLVHGDTLAAYAAANAAFFMGIPIGHVEAGLRTHDLTRPFPEEYHRRAIGILSSLDFAPTEGAVENLIVEGKNRETVFLVGNTVVDAMRYTVTPQFSCPLLDALTGKRILLVTAHRRENLGPPQMRIFRAVRRIAERYPDVAVVMPLHPNPAVRYAAEEFFRDPNSSRIRLTEPFDVKTCHNLLSRACVVLTDSGGLQEEAPALGKPVLLLRESTERPEGVHAGAVELCGSDEERIFSAAAKLLDDPSHYAAMARQRLLYGDGNASARIADVIEAKIF